MYQLPIDQVRQFNLEGVQPKEWEILEELIPLMGIQIESFCDSVYYSVMSKYKEPNSECIPLCKCPWRHTKKVQLHPYELSRRVLLAWKKGDLRVIPRGVIKIIVDYCVYELLV